jgi:glycerophosphoryl diester phosphodiesterase
MHPALRPALALLAFAVPLQAQHIVAHRGASRDAPENTLAAFRLAWAQGADGVEGDFRLTADGEIVCMHDRDTLRTSGAELVVAESTLAALRALDVGSWKAPRFAGERVPTLDEVLASVPAGRFVLIEVKCGPEIVPALDRSLTATALAPRQLRVIAFDPAVIAACKARMPEIDAYWLTGHERDEATGRWSNSLAETLPTLARIGADGLDTSVPPEVVDAAFVRALRAARMQVHAWTVDDARTAARLYWLGVDSITTNVPAELRAALPRRELRGHVELHLPLDGDLCDARPGAAGGELLAARTQEAQPSFVPGVYGRALDLAGGAGAVRIGRPLPERGTLAFWYRPRGWYDYQTLFDSPADPNGWELWIYADARLRFRAHPGGAVLSHAFHPTGDADEWHHVALAWDRADEGPEALQLHVNGHLAQSCAWSSSGWFPAGESFFLGGGNAGNTRARGTFDEVVLFDVPLSRAEVRFLARAALQ